MKKKIHLNLFSLGRRIRKPLSEFILATLQRHLVVSWGGLAWPPQLTARWRWRVANLFYPNERFHRWEGCHPKVPVNLIPQEDKKYL